MQYFNYTYLQGFSQNFEMGCPHAIFHKNGVSNSYPFDSQIPNLRVHKFKIGCPKVGWTGL